MMADSVRLGDTALEKTTPTICILNALHSSNRPPGKRPAWRGTTRNRDEQLGRSDPSETLGIEAEGGQVNQDALAASRFLAVQIDNDGLGGPGTERSSQSSQSITSTKSDSGSGLRRPSFR